MEKINAEELKKIANVQTLTDEELETVAGGASYGRCADSAGRDFEDCKIDCDCTYGVGNSASCRLACGDTYNEMMAVCDAGG